MLRLQWPSVFSRFAAVLLAAGLRSEATATDISGLLQTVATEGQSAPGGGFFGDFSSVGPVIDETGEVYFENFVTSASNSPGVFRGTPGHLSALFRVRAVDPAGGFLNSISNPIVSGSTLAFLGTDTLEHQDVYLYSAGKIRNLARTGKAAPGGGTFSAFDTAISNAAGQVLFHATTLGGAGDGLFFADGTHLVTLAAIGEASPDGSTYSSFASDPLVLTDSGAAIFYATTAAGAGLYLASGSGAQVIAVDGGAAPEGGVYSALTGEFAASGSGSIVFCTSDGIYTGLPGAIQLLASTQDNAEDGGAFFGFSSPCINSNNQIAFSASDSGPTQGGLFLASQNLVTQVAGYTSALGGGDIVAFDVGSLSETGQLAFLATTSGGGRIYESDGVELVQISSVGDSLPGGTISNLFLASAPGGPNAGVINSAGQIIFSADYGANKSGVFVVRPNLYWRLPGDGNWDDSGVWTLGLTPVASSVVTIDPASSLTVNGPRANLSIASLQIGGGAGVATLSVNPSVTLTAASGVTILSTGALQNGGIIAGNLKNAGALSAGAAVGNAEFRGNVALQTTSHLAMRLGGLNKGVDSDFLRVTGALSLGGTLDVSLVNGLSPQPGDRYTLFTASARSGKFATFNLPPLVTGLSWDTQRLAVDGTLSVSGATFFQGVAGVYEGVIGAQNAAFADSGSIALNVAANGKFSAAIHFAGSVYAISGYFKTDGTAVGTLGKTGDSVELQLDISGGSGSLSGSILQSATTVAGITGFVQATGFTKANPVSEIGSYTFLLPADSSQPTAAYPQGSGFGTMKVLATGKMQVVGVLGDGTPFSAGGVLAKDGKFRLYRPLYGGKGSISGALSFASAGAGLPYNISGSLNWFKLQSKAAQFGAGFQGLVASAGASYDSAQLAFPAGPATLSFEDGNIVVAPQTKNLTLDPKDKVALAGEPKFLMSFTQTSGLFSGKFQDSTGKTRSFRGAVLQGETSGGGYFQGDDQTGSVALASGS